MNGGDCGVWSVCKVAHVSHCAGLLADSLADSKQVGVRVVVTAASGRGRRPLQTPKVSIRAHRHTTHKPVGKTAEERRAYYDLEAVEPLLRATSTVEIVTTIPHDRGRRHA